MSAETLRAAAKLMRSRATTASEDGPTSPWRSGPMLDPDNDGCFVAYGSPDDDYDTTVARCPYDYEGHAAAHIASWHPAVALAVADQLDAMAAVIDEAGDGPLALVAAGLAEQSLAVATAYLGQP